MKDTELSDYTYRDLTKEKPEGLCWRMFYESNGKFYVSNILDEHGCGLYGAIAKIKNKYKTKEEFAERLHHEVLYRFWAKSEWEVIVTTWPPYVDSEEIDRLVKEREDRIKSWGNFYCTDVRLEHGVKLDVYTQLALNWDRFIDYVWKNRKLFVRHREK